MDADNWRVQEGLDLFFQQHPQQGGGVFMFLHGTRRIDLSALLAAQGIGDGSELTLVFVSISDQQREAVIDKMYYRGQPINGDDEVDALDSIVDLSLDGDFDRTLEVLPAGLQTLTFGYSFNQSLDKTALPACLQTLTFGLQFNQSLDKTALPAGLQTLTLGLCFNQSLDKTALPAGLQTLTFGYNFKRSLDIGTASSRCKILRY